MKEIKCVVVGDSCTRKRDSLIVFTCGWVPEEYIPTSFDNLSALLLLPNEVPVCIQFWDTSGQENYEKLRTLSYPQTNVFVYFFKISDPISFGNIESIWIPEVEACCPNVPAILVATFCELIDEPEKVDGNQGERIIEDEEVRRLMKKHPNIKDYCKISVKKNIGITEAFTSAAIVSFNGEEHQIRKKKIEELKNVRKFAVAIGDVGKVVHPFKTDYELMIMNDFVDIFDIGRRASTLIIAFANREMLQDALDGIDETLRKQEKFESVILLHIHQNDVFDGVTGLDVKQAIRRMVESSCSVSYTKIEDGYKWEELRDIVLGERDKTELDSNSAQTNTECAIA